jgi:hypothetical protein
MTQFTREKFLIVDGARKALHRNKNTLLGSLTVP